ncbi:MFS transporter [Pseudorhizobium endolithicum]|uniref:MFS transporter n=1 Tax=Pseudorhizobium endolithicum TaxID=1191678 RepID=A0ABN7JJ11_9HYPH|nr:MFS transporter [Pseudorhizobium endolithicum]CAD7031525.1 MFS transporter [Pseudorhizobium endolithicum]
MASAEPLHDSISSADVSHIRSSRIPPAIYLLGAAVFAVTTSEFMVAGIMPSLSSALGVSVGEIGYLISYFALGMTIGGPLATALLLALRVRNKAAFLWLLGLFVLGSIVTAIAPNYGVMALGRIIQGISSGGCFGIALTICASLVSSNRRGRAVSVVLAGLMLSPVVGVPATAMIEQSFGWRASFWSVVVLAALAMTVVAIGVPSAKHDGSADLRSSLAALRNGRLWTAYLTSSLIIGATFAAFSYFSPIFTQIAGLPEGVIPILLAIYGLANVLGNLVIGRFADRFTIPILIGGLTILAFALATFALFATIPAIAIAAFITIGLFGVTMNPAMAARVMRAAHPDPMVNAVHSSVITTGLAVGTWAGGLGIDAGYGLTAPLWVGFALALAGLLSLAPRRARRLS